MENHMSGDLPSLKIESQRPTLPEHNTLLNRLRSAISNLLESNVDVQDIPLSNEVLDRSVTDVLSSPPEINLPK